MYKTISLIMALSLILTSCCTMTRHSTARIQVTSQQRDTDILIDGYSCGTAPVWVDLDRACNHTIIASKAGYPEQYVQLKSKRTWGSTSNFLFPVAGAAVGTGVGLMTYGTHGYILPFFIGGTLVGGAIGLGLGVLGTATDLCKRSDCDLNAKAVHFDLCQE